MRATSIAADLLVISADACGDRCHAAMTVKIKLARQFDGIVDGELGARTDGEMRGMCGVTHQHHMGLLPLKWLQLAADQAG